MRRSDLVASPAKATGARTTQIVFGERQHLLRVLDSLENTSLTAGRLAHERDVYKRQRDQYAREC